MRKQLPQSVTNNKKYVPLEYVDLLATAEEFFTVGVIVDIQGPTTSKSGKTFMTLKVSNLVKYDLTRLKKYCYP